MVRHVGLQKHNLDSIKQPYTFYCAHVHRWSDAILVIFIYMERENMNMTLVLDKLGWRSWYSLSMRTCQGPTPTCTCPGVETRWRHVVSHPLPPSFLLHPSGYKEERASTGRASLKGVSRSAVSPGDVRGPRRRGTGSSSQRTTRIKDTRWVLLRSASVNKGKILRSKGRFGERRRLILPQTFPGAILQFQKRLAPQTRKYLV